MAHSDKNIVITPNIGSTTADPQIVFSGANASLGPQNITLRTYATSNGTLSFEGSAGQLFSITNSLSGTIFSVNDVSGIPSIEVLDTGTVRIAQYSGNVGIGVASPTEKLHVVGNIIATGDITAYFSDDRLKTRLGTIIDAVTKVKSLTGFYYEANETAQALGYTPKREIGISAQDVEKILPEIVAPAPVDNQYLTIKYEKLAPLFVQAIKEQQTQIDELKNQIDTLKSVLNTSIGK